MLLSFLVGIYESHNRVAPNVDAFRSHGCDGTDELDSMRVLRVLEKKQQKYMLLVVIMFQSTVPKHVRKHNNKA